MNTLDTILRMLEDLDDAGYPVTIDRQRIKRRRSGKISSIEFSGYADAEIGFEMTFTVGIDDADPMDPLEIAARVMNRDNPDYDFASDPEYADLRSEGA